MIYSHHYEYTKNHLTIHFKRVNCIVYKFDLNEAFFKGTFIEYLTINEVVLSTFSNDSICVSTLTTSVSASITFLVTFLDFLKLSFHPSLPFHSQTQLIQIFLHVSHTVPPLSSVHINLKCPQQTQRSEDFWGGHGVGNGNVGSRAHPFHHSQVQTFYFSQTVPLSFFKYIMSQFLFMRCLLTSGLLRLLCPLKTY